MDSIKLYRSLTYLGLIASLLVNSTAVAAVPLPVLSKEVEMEDLEKFKDRVMKRLRQNLHMEDKEEEHRVNLFDAVRVLFARRDHDGNRSKVLNSFRSMLSEDEMEVMDRVVEESISGVKDHSLAVQEQKTHYMILHNFIKEYQGRKKDYAPLLARIKDAKIKLSDKLKKENVLTTMTDSDSPSKAAARALGEKAE